MQLESRPRLPAARQTSRLPPRATTDPVAPCLHGVYGVRMSNKSNSWSAEPPLEPGVGPTHTGYR